jgi:hypothetical protein
MWQALIERIQLHKLNITVILLYLLFTSIFTFPLFLHISTGTPLVDAQGDQFQSMWMFWWFKTALFHLQTSPLYTTFLFYPHGTTLIYHMPVFLGLLALPFQYLFGPPAGLIIGYNLILLFTFVLSGFGVFLLTKYLIKDPVAAFICGMFFAFSTYRLSNLSHVGLLSTEWIPFYILYLLKFMDQKHLKYALGVGIFFVFTYLSDLTCALFLVVFTLIYVVYILITSGKRLWDKKIILNSAITLFSVAIILFPFLYSLSSNPIDWPIQTKEQITYSANLLGYFLPVSERSLWGSSFLPSEHSYFGVAGEEIFLGYVLLFFVLYTLITRSRERIKFWFFSSLAFGLLSLGHSLYIYNHSYHFPWLPYNILYTYIPLLHLGRTPCRFSLMVTLCLIIFSGYGLTRFFSSHHSKSENLFDLKNFFRGFLVRKGIPLLVVVLICLEFIVVPTKLIHVEVPESYRKIKEEPGEFAILELPSSFLGNSLMGNAYLLYQTVHEKRLVDGLLPRYSLHSRDFLNEIMPKEDISFDSEFWGKLSRNDIKYVIVHEFPGLAEKIREDTAFLVIKEKPSDIEIYQVF